MFANGVKSAVRDLGTKISCVVSLSLLISHVAFAQSSGVLVYQPEAKDSIHATWEQTVDYILHAHQYPELMSGRGQTLFLFGSPEKCELRFRTITTVNDDPIKVATIDQQDIDLAKVSRIYVRSYPPPIKGIPGYFAVELSGKAKASFVVSTSVLHRSSKQQDDPLSLARETPLNEQLSCRDKQREQSGGSSCRSSVRVSNHYSLKYATAEQAMNISRALLNAANLCGGNAESAGSSHAPTLTRAMLPSQELYR